MGTRSANKDNRGAPLDKILGQTMAMRGNAQPRMGYWEKLLPQARKRVVELGLFTEAGEITEKGKEMLRRGDA